MPACQYARWGSCSVRRTCVVLQLLLQLPHLRLRLARARRSPCQGRILHAAMGRHRRGRALLACTDVAADGCWRGSCASYMAPCRAGCSMTAFRHPHYDMGSRGVAVAAGRLTRAALPWLPALRAAPWLRAPAATHAAPPPAWLTGSMEGCGLMGAAAGACGDGYHSLCGHVP